MEKQIKKNIIRIALIGPESTAKSTLSEALAIHYHTVWVKEYSREYLQGINKNYTNEDIEAIAKGQLANELKLIDSANKIIFSDTELIISKVWCEDVFKTCPDWIRKNIPVYKYDLYLLTYPDIPWEPDPLRENPDRREFFFNWYEQEINFIKGDYKIIKGSGSERVKNAIEAVEAFFGKHNKNFNSLY